MHYNAYKEDIAWLIPKITSTINELDKVLQGMYIKAWKNNDKKSELFLHKYFLKGNLILIWSLKQVCLFKSGGLDELIELYLKPIEEFVANEEAKKHIETIKKLLSETELFKRERVEFQLVGIRDKVYNN